MKTNHPTAVITPPAIEHAARVARRYARPYGHFFTRNEYLSIREEIALRYAERMERKAASRASLSSVEGGEG